MSWLLGILKTLFSVFLTTVVDEIKKPDEAHFVGGDKEITDDIAADIEKQIFGEEETQKITNDHPALKNFKDQDHG